MFGAIYKAFFCKKMGVDPEDVVFVSAIPCTAKKFEVGREGQSNDDLQNVDIAVTTRELGRMIESAGRIPICFPRQKPGRSSENWKLW